MAAALFLGLFRRSFSRADADAFDLYPGQLPAVSDRAMITFTPFKFERDHFFVLALFDDFGSDFGAGDNRVSMRKVFPVGIHQDIAERRGLPRLNVEKIDIDCIAFLYTILPAASFDNCVSHRFPRGEKPRKIPQLRGMCKRKGRGGSPEPPAARVITVEAIAFNRPYLRSSAQSPLWEDEPDSAPAAH